MRNPYTIMFFALGSIYVNTFCESIKYSTLTETLNWDWEFSICRNAGIVTPRWTLREPIRFYSPTSVVGFLIEFLLLRQRLLVLACCRRLLLLCLPCLSHAYQVTKVIGKFAAKCLDVDTDVAQCNCSWSLILVDSEYTGQECQQLIPFAAIKINRPTGINT